MAVARHVDLVSADGGISPQQPALPAPGTAGGRYMAACCCPRCRALSTRSTASRHDDVKSLDRPSNNLAACSDICCAHLSMSPFRRHQDLSSAAHLLTRMWSKLITRRLLWNGVEPGCFSVMSPMASSCASTSPCTSCIDAYSNFSLLKHVEQACEVHSTASSGHVVSMGRASLPTSPFAVRMVTWQPTSTWLRTSAIAPPPPRAILAWITSATPSLGPSDHAATGNRHSVRSRQADGTDRDV